MSDPLYKDAYPHWKTSYEPDSREGVVEVTGLMAHVMSISGRGHSEDPVWVKQQTQPYLISEHRIYHENGGKHHK